MIYHFEEIPVTVNGLTYLADGQVEYDWDYEFDEPNLQSIQVAYLWDGADGFVDSNICFLAESILVEEFYKSDSMLYDEVCEHWSEMQ